MKGVMINKNIPLPKYIIPTSPIVNHENNFDAFEFITFPQSDVLQTFVIKLLVSPNSRHVLNNQDHLNNHP